MLAPILALALIAGTASPPGSARIAVMPLRAGSGIQPADGAAITEALVGEVRKRSGAEVITQGEIVSILTMEQQRKMLGCSTDACMAELGGALGVGRLVTGDVARLGESLMIHVRLIDSARVRVLVQADRRLKRGSYDDVLDALPAIAAELFAPEQKPGAAPVASPARVEPAASSRPAETRPAAAAFVPPPGMFAIHIRVAKDLALIAWSEEAGLNRANTFRRFVTPWGGFMLPSGTTDFGFYWLLPAAEFKTGTATFGFLAPTRFHGNGERPESKLGSGCCGQMSWTLADAPQIWIDPVECRPHRTVDEALRAGK